MFRFDRAFAQSRNRRGKSGWHDKHAGTTWGSTSGNGKLAGF
jgi:hypothetical protein